MTVHLCQHVKFPGPICGAGHSRYPNGSIHLTKDCACCMHYEGECRGLGDRVHAVANAIGVTRVILTIEGRTKWRCGCGNRRAKLNALS